MVAIRETDVDVSEQQRPDREERWQQRLALPVLLAALASVPAVFLTLLEDPYSIAGDVVNWLAGGVLVAETVVLFVVSADKRRWVREHVWLILLTVAIVAGVVLAVGPVQLLRLLRVFGALRFMRAGRIVKAGKIVRERMGWTGRWSAVPPILASLLVAVFVAVALVDPSSSTRELLDGWLGGTGIVVAAVLAGLLLAGATWVVVRQQQSEHRD